VVTVHALLSGGVIQISSLLKSFWSQANQRSLDADAELAGKIACGPGQFTRGGTLGLQLLSRVVFMLIFLSIALWKSGAMAEHNPLGMPAVGTHGLSVLSPGLLELTLINSKAQDPARLTSWDLVGSNSQLNAPPPSDFAVSAAGQKVAVRSVGFKRRPLYAPLKQRDLRIGNFLYLELAAPLAEGQVVEVSNPKGNLWPSTSQFVATVDPMRLNPAIHVNQVGYAPAFPKKAMVGYYLGSMGEMRIPAQEGFRIIDNSGSTVFQGMLVQRPDRGFTYLPAPYQQVWEADFSGFTAPGEYRLMVPGMGASYPFLINEGIASAFARTFALGIYHQRCGTNNDFPFTRHCHEVCHSAPVQVPNMSFAVVNRELSSMTSDFAKSQTTAPRLENVNASLYPFVELADRDVSGGHHDAGDYSKYTINSAGFIHFLVFAADAFAGAGSLDNLGIPESGDGKSDLLQTAKWEADFLAKMQDSDGGFYFLVYPRNRRYEDDVLPDKGDPQVVFPKTTSVTAAAVGALAEIGSSPLFKQQFPKESALYLEKAKRGWDFLQRAIAKHGKAGAYQKVTHYGNEFRHDDELAWAASAMFAATGDQAYHNQLKAWYNPSDPNTRRWSWWRLFEGYGCAARTYAFAARSGRLPASALDPSYLAKCQAEIIAAGDDHVRFSRDSAYGTSFPDQNKLNRAAGWYFSSERAFDATVAYQLNPRAEYLDTVIGNLNYEAGCNPLNMTFITGVGSKRQREIVHQYALNDRRVLPPSGIPLGNIQASFQFLHNYRGELEALSFPPNHAITAPYPYYDRWTDTFNTTTEFVVTDQARSLASLAFWMAQTSLKDQSWRAASGQITGLPSHTPAKEKVTAQIVVPGLDLTEATIVWEARDQEPVFGNPVTFAAKHTGVQWVEVEAQLPDGRRIFAATNFVATTAMDTVPNNFESSPLAVAPDMVALFHLDQDLADATGRQGQLTLSGNARIDTSNLGWMRLRQGASLYFGDIGDKAALQIPSAALRGGEETTAVILEAMIYVDSYLGYNRSSAPILMLHDTWNAYLELGEDKYAGPYIRGGKQMEINASTIRSVLPAKQWHHLAMEINKVGYVVRVNGQVVVTEISNELANWGRSGTARLEFGNFDGWIDEVVVRSVRNTAPPNKAPTASMISPAAGASFTAPANITLSAYAADVDGSIARVEFFHGNTKIGEVTSGSFPYNFVWNGVQPGNYTLTAKATDNLGASAMSSPVPITVLVPHQTVAAPVISPGGGGFSGSVNVTVTSATPGATIRYTTNGTQPSGSSPVYTGPFALSSSSTVRAQAFMAGMAESSVTTASFLITSESSSSAQVTFISTDRATQGNWRGTYGLDGFNIITHSAKLPAYAQVSALGKNDYSWSDNTQDVRALQKTAGSSRVAACWYSSTAFNIDLKLTDGQAHRLALYFLDWDRSGRSQTIEVIDPDGTVLNTQTISSFQDGLYLVWDVRGTVRIRLSRLSGPNAVVMGVFLSPTKSASTEPTGSARLTLPSRHQITSNGLQLQISGEPGRYIIESSPDLIDWQPVSTNTLSSEPLEFVAPNTTGQPNQFYRVRSAPEQSQYLIETSSDLVRWVPLRISSSAGDLASFMQEDSGKHDLRFYRATAIAEGQKLYLVEVSSNAIDWEPLQTHTSEAVPAELLSQNSGAIRFFRTRPLF
jgi:hypothetical protein